MSHWHRKESNMHPEAWEYGRSSTEDNWASIIASNTGSISGRYGDEWVLEYYNGVDTIQQREAESYPEMLLIAHTLMQQHIGRLQAREDAFGEGGE